MKARITAAALLLAAGLGAPLWAATIVSTEVTNHGQRYSVSYEALLNADTERVRAVITDYERYHRLSTVVAESRVLERHAAGVLRIRLLLKPCIWIFCVSMPKVSDVFDAGNGEIVYVGVPEHSRFRSSHEHIRIVPDGARTRVRYEADLVPAFYVPPFLGPLIVKRRIQQELEVVAEKVEALAATNVAAEVQP